MSWFQKITLILLALPTSENQKTLDRPERSRDTEEMTCNDPQCSASEKKTMRHYLRKWRGELWYWLFLNIWCRHCYRHVMKFAHRFNWHHMERTPILDETSTSPDKGLLGYLAYRKRYLRCSWCGVSGYVLKTDHEK